MKTLKRVTKGAVVLVNIILCYFIISGIYGYFIAYNPERKTSWLLATLLWLVILSVVDLIYLFVKKYYHRNEK